MKRDHKSLLRDRTEEEVDARIRRELQQDADSMERRERVVQQDIVRVAAMLKNLQKWNEGNLKIANDYAVAEPDMVPIGTQESSTFVPLLGPSFHAPSFSYIL